MAQKFTVRVRRGLDKIVEHHQEQILEHAHEGLTADEKRDVGAALQWMRGLELNPLYSQGMQRVGCMPCINCGKDELLEIAKRYPQHIDKVREWERLVCLAAKRGWTTFFTDAKEDDDEPDESVYGRLRIDERVQWARTSRGGRQFDLVRNDEPEQCSSVYGLCE